MTERPIIFSAEMVRAILEGRKTQTRRVIKPQPTVFSDWDWDAEVGDVALRNDQLYVLRESQGRYKAAAGELTPVKKKCPYGQPGDQLWVKETYGFEPSLDRQLAEDGLTPGQVDLSGECHIGYRADGSGAYVVKKWRPSIFMPRWASRITLAIKAVRAERVQDISEADAKAEGVEINWLGSDPIPDEYKEEYRRYGADDEDFPCFSARESFQTLWDSINAKRGHPFDANDWVWAIEFERLEVKP